MSLFDRLTQQLKQRGLSVAPGRKPGELLLHGPAAEKTPDVVKAVKTFKAEFIERLGLDVPTHCGKCDTLEPRPAIAARECPMIGCPFRPNQDAN
jgi:hypothetical protein